MISYKDTDSKEYNENDGGKHIDISVVVPVYGCPGALPELHKRLTSTLSKLVKEYEIILVDDCDKKNSWAEVAKLCEKDNHVKGFHLSRNFGQPHAITCGVDYCSGEWLVVMDCDLQGTDRKLLQIFIRRLWKAMMLSSHFVRNVRIQQLPKPFLKCSIGFMSSFRE